MDLKYPPGDLRNIFDIFLEVSLKQQALERLRSEVRRLGENARKKCGNCDKWMKSRECPREKNVNGWNKGPSMNDWPCAEFVSDSQHLHWIAEHENARARLAAQLGEMA